MEGQRHWIHIELPKKRARRETGQWDSLSQKGNTGITRGGEGAGVKLAQQVAHKGQFVHCLILGAQSSRLGRVLLSTCSSSVKHALFDLML